MKPHHTRYAYAVVLESARHFVALKEEWEDLCHNSPVATPFQSWAWLYSWWESYGADYELRLVAVRNDEDLLVGILPFMTQSRRGFGRLLFVGTGQSDYCDVIVRAGWEDAVSEAGVQALGRIESWHIADLEQLRPSAATWSILRRWGGLQLCQQQVPYPVMEVKPWDEMLASLGRRFRQETRRALRRAEADGIYTKGEG
jgi:CelD/BcsL family acetyltransferase involved in cellulose biosynthesis